MVDLVNGRCNGRKQCKHREQRLLGTSAGDGNPQRRIDVAFGKGPCRKLAQRTAKGMSHSRLYRTINASKEISPSMAINGTYKW